MSYEEIKDLAYKCMELWSTDRWTECYQTYYAQDAVKVEPTVVGEYANEISGLDALASQEEYIQNDLMEVHAVYVSEGPFFRANGFAVIIKSDFTVKATGERHIFRELGVYDVKDGKITREEYIYDEAEYLMSMKLAEQDV